MQKNNDYKGIKILKKIIIVENKTGQGYLVNPDNKNMLENALNWAKSNIGHWEYYEENGKKKSKWVLEKEFEGIIHEYENGNFELSLEDSASYSSQGGKLSFWDCKVKAPDNKEFIIGINSDILLNLMKANTFVYGKCQEKVFLGREKTRVGAYTQNMEEYQQSFEDENLRDRLKKESTSKYVPGDVVRTLTEESIYLGELYKLFDYSFDEPWYRRAEKINVKIFKKPKIVYCYLVKSKCTGDYIYFSESATKAKKLIIGKEKCSLEKEFEKRKEELCSKNAWWYPWQYQMSLDKNSKISEEDIHKVMKDFVRRTMAYRDCEIIIEKENN